MTHQEIKELAGHRAVSPWIMKLVSDCVAIEREACEKAIQQSRAYQLVFYPDGYTISPNKINSFYEFQWKRSLEAIQARGKA